MSTLPSSWFFKVDQNNITIYNIYAYLDVYTESQIVSPPADLKHVSIYEGEIVITNVSDSYKSWYTQSASSKGFYLKDSEGQYVSYLNGVISLSAVSLNPFPSSWLFKIDETKDTPIYLNASMAPNAAAPATGVELVYRDNGTSTWSFKYKNTDDFYIMLDGSSFVVGQYSDSNTLVLVKENEVAVGYKVLAFKMLLPSNKIVLATDPSKGIYTPYENPNGFYTLSSTDTCIPFVMDDKF